LPRRSAGDTSGFPDPACSWISRTVQALIGLTIASASHSGSAASSTATSVAPLAVFPDLPDFVAGNAGGTVPPSVIDSSTAISAMPSAMQ
jgi:hypothetical protein